MASSAIIGGKARAETLVEILSAQSLGSEERLKAVSELKVIARQVENVDPLTTKKGLEVLTYNAFTVDDAPVRREAQRCLANALLLKPDDRGTFAEVGGVDKFVAAFRASVKKRDADDDFLLGRIGFLLTATKGPVVERLVHGDAVLEDMNEILVSYVNLCQEHKLLGTSPMALTELLKFLYNMSFHIKLDDDAGSRLSKPLVQLILAASTQEFNSPYTNAIHCCLNLNLEPVKSQLFPDDSPTQVVQQLVEILDKQIPGDTESIHDSSLDENLSPVVILLNNIQEVAPDQVKTYLKTTLMPSESDRIVPLGQGATLPARLLRLTTNAYTQTLREAILTLFYALVDSFPSAFVDAIGYGYASGFLFSHNIPVPSNVQLSNDATGRTESTARTDVNPITGQRVDAEPEGPDLSQMTEEEKEREAERLFVLFERMRSLGVGVENPIRAFQQSGRFEELDQE